MRMHRPCDFIKGFDRLEHQGHTEKYRVPLMLFSLRRDALCCFYGLRRAAAALRLPGRGGYCRILR